MTTVRVSASREYDILIGSGLLPRAGALISDISHSRYAAIVTDDTVDRLYAGVLESSLEQIGFKTVKFVIAHGERSKNAENYVALLNFLAEKHLTRGDTVIALGGGVVGDLAAFAAATYLRGIRLVQAPTTLLAAVDSSVGGKTAIDLVQGKNLAGAFYQPSLVICDHGTLATLPLETFRDGCSESIKCAVIGDEELFDHLFERGKNFDTEFVISRCVGLKRDIVADDEFDTGKRQLLNLGHTVGHAIEKLSGYEISHGSAVAAGMAVITRAAAAKGICSRDSAERILSALERFGLPTGTDFGCAELYDAMLSDKKISGDAITLVMPERVGRCILMKTPVTELADILKAGL